MNRAVIYGILLLAAGTAAGVVVGSRVATTDEPVASESRPPRVSQPGVRGDRQQELEIQLERLSSRLTAEADERRGLEERIAGLESALSALHNGTAEGEAASSATTDSGAAGQAQVASSGSAPADPGPVGTEDGGAEALTPMEHALIAAGVDPETAAGIKKKQDELALSEIYLRDQASREGWSDTPRFSQEMADIESQRTSVRDQIGDDAYDRYLAALDHPNRVTVNDVLLESPAAAAGLQAGDVVLSYGDTRIFSPDELVAATRSGTSGEPVRLQVLRQGQPLEIDVPRGPLGVRIAASRGTPGDG